MRWARSWAASSRLRCCSARVRCESSSYLPASRTPVATSAACFGALHAAGLLRVSPEDEEVGVDVAEHGEPLLEHGSRYEKASPRAVEATSTKTSAVEMAPSSVSTA